MEHKLKYLIMIALFISCNQDYNNNEIQILSKLERVTNTDLHDLQKLEIKNVYNALKIAKLNLTKIEEKKLDSIEIELIYFEYRDYLNCVNNLYESTQKIPLLINTLYKNKSQLENMKSDYQYSKERRLDLDKYLVQEDSIVNTTSMEVHDLLQLINREQFRFDTLNKKMEEIIY
tara:strand:- start:1065 stop:1589 length:525 start_codon:yes stop_codon:yes gene_type:complete